MVENIFIAQQDNILPDVSPTELSEEELNCCTVNLREIIECGMRLEASVFDIDGKHAREVISRCKYDTFNLAGDNSFIRRVFYPGRCKRFYCSKDNVNSIGFLGSSEMLDIKPEPKKFMSPKNNDIEKFKVEKEWILLSRSGTIGNVAFVNNTLKKHLISEHAIRIICKNNPGYIYAFLRTNIGYSLIKSNIYGAVVDQIEPMHLESIPIPNPSFNIKKKINDLILKSFYLRDESNYLVDNAKSLLYDALKLPPLKKLKKLYFDQHQNNRNFYIKLSDLDYRIDASYHVPIVDTIIKHLRKVALEVITISDNRISKKIILPGRFKRIYVKEGQGTVFFGGKQIYELDPSNKKYLSLAKHSDRIKNELILEKNWLIITARGTIGKLAIVPKHWVGWVMSDNMIRVVPSTKEIAGYLYIFLASDYGQELIKRFTYGAVVDAIEPSHIAEVCVPLLKDKTIQRRINNLVFEANEKRTEAYYIEQEAIRITNDEVIYA